jgi:hypothetical protein
MFPANSKPLPQTIVDQLERMTHLTRRMEMGESRHNDTTVEFYWIKPQTISRIWYDQREQDRLKDIKLWCIDTFGKNDNSWTNGWETTDGKYYFVREADRTLFILRWQ